MVITIKERLDEVRDRLRAATPGSWDFWEYTNLPDRPHGVLVPVSTDHPICPYNATHFQRREDSIFVAHAPKDIEFLLHTIDMLTRRLEDLSTSAVEDVRSCTIDNSASLPSMSESSPTTNSPSTSTGDVLSSARGAKEKSSPED